MPAAQCPYCKQGLGKVPTQKTKCPHCGNFIFVRRGNLVTEKGPEDADETYGDILHLRPFGVTEGQFEATRKELKLQFNQDPSANDVAWRILDSLLVRPGQDQVRIYRAMADIVRFENKDPSPYIKEAMQIYVVEWRRKLREIINSAPDRMGRGPVVVVGNCNDQFVCPECREVEKRRFEGEAARVLEDLSLRCTSTLGCRCSLAEDVRR